MLAVEPEQGNPRQRLAGAARWPFCTACSLGFGPALADAVTEAASTARHSRTKRSGFMVDALR
jgi:hypothetical protein